MTTLREAAQQALEALELGYDSAKAEADQYHAAMAGYRPQRHAQMDADVQQIASAITALRAALVEPVQEPVAWSFEARHIDTAFGPAVSIRHPGREHKYMRNVKPLYLAPPQRKPMTEEEIYSIWDSEKAFADIYAIARAIERAHGIT